MKNLLLSLLLCLPLLVNAQELPVDKETGLITYTEVVPVEGLSQDELYSRARAWFAIAFKSANHVIQLEDQEQGRIIGKGIVNWGATGGSSDMFFTLDVQFKDGRYRYQVDNISYKSPASTRQWPAEEVLFSPNAKKKDGKYRALPLLYVTQTESAIAELTASLNKAISSDNSAKDNW